MTINKYPQGNTKIELGDSPTIDAFARLRISQPHTIFDSKQLIDNAPLFWDDQEVSGAGTTSSYSANTSSSVMSVSNATAGKRVRQTFMRFNYQPGKSQVIFLTGVLDKSGGGAGIIRAIGAFDDQNGIFFRDNESTIEAVIRSYTSGAAVDNAVSQSNWNLDTMDGNGKSGINLDFSKAQIFFIDYEWLGVGRVRVGFVIDGIPVYCHEFLHANVETAAYMTTPNLPLRYEIENDGTGAASSIEDICCSIISEGGATDTGAIRYYSTAGTHVDANAADTIYALVGIRLKSTALDSFIRIRDLSILSETNDDFEWLLIINPTIAGTFTFSDITNSCLQAARGATANTVTGGTILAGGFGTKGAAIEVSEALNNTITLGSTISGIADRIVLCVRPLSSNADIQGSLSWVEVSM
jgi:hypothetical protein